MKLPSEPDYMKLKLILENELNRTVSMEETIATGKHLMNIYEVLLFNRG